MTVRGGVQPGGYVDFTLFLSANFFFFSKKPFGNAWENPRKTFGKFIANEQLEKSFGKCLGKAFGKSLWVEPSLQSSWEGPP